MSERFDIAILGFGKAGKTIAAKLASKGKKVVLVEKDANMYGGTCINVGCIPSKRLVTEAELAPKSDVDAQNLDVLPERLTIIGGGYIGLEFASMYANFGSKVTILQIEDAFLPREDTDIADNIESVLATKGVTVIKGVTFQAVKGNTVMYTQGGATHELAGDAILVATGRKPNTKSLDCDKAGVALTDRGAVITDEHLRTSVPNIWAAGDVCGKLQFTYISLDDSRIILDDMNGAGERTTENRGAFAYSVFMDPPFARVGLNEKEATKQGLKYRVVKMDTNAIPKAKVSKKTEGMLKALIEEGTGKVLGVQLFCVESHEIINMMKLAIDQGVDYTVLRDFIYTHPTIAEGLIVIRYYLALRGAENGVTAMVTPFFCVQGWISQQQARKSQESLHHPRS